MIDLLAEFVNRWVYRGFRCAGMLRGDHDWIVCRCCPSHGGRNVRHPLSNSRDVRLEIRDFKEKHPEDSGHHVARLTPWEMERAVRAEERRRHRLHLARFGFIDNSDFKEAFGSVTALDLTAIAISTSTTAGWCSCWIDNSSTLYPDIAFWYYSQAVNTVASSQKAHFLYGPGSWLTTDRPVNSAGNAATNSGATSAVLTFNDITANSPGAGFPQIKVAPYVTTNTPINTGIFGIAKGHDFICPKVVWLALINAAGPTIGTGGGTPTKISYAGSYNTII